MVNEQPEALRLADELESEGDSWFRERDEEAAAELRRLHAENEDYGATCDYLTRENAEQIGEIVALKEQRDELLEALKQPRQPLTDEQIADIEDMFSNEFGLEAKHAVDFARAIERAHGIGGKE